MRAHLTARSGTRQSFTLKKRFDRRETHRTGEPFAVAGKRHQLLFWLIPPSGEV